MALFGGEVIAEFAGEEVDGEGGVLDIVGLGGVVDVFLDIEEVILEEGDGFGDLGLEFCAVGFGLEVAEVIDELVFGIEGEGFFEVGERVLVEVGFGDGAEVVGLGIEGVGF